ncbi:MAG: hypothetical protein FWC03_00420 [Treponema sp.]|nr:hypothetical protein [Treponema sp.]
MRIFSEEAIMRREFYLHKRKNGIFYVEFINPENGIKLFARSTGESDKIKAQVKAELWKKSGIPTGRFKKPRPLFEAAGIESIIDLFNNHLTRQPIIVNESAD